MMRGNPGSLRRFRRGVGLLFGLSVAVLPCAGREKSRDTGEAAVGKAVERGAEYVKSKQGKNGFWAGGGREAGATALAVYTLLKANCPPSEHAVCSGVAALAGSSISSNAAGASTYEVALTAMAMATIIEKAGKGPDVRVPGMDLDSCRQTLREATDWLVAAQHDCRGASRPGGVSSPGRKKADESGACYDLDSYRKGRAGAWGYRLADSNYVDNSNTQFALLGLRAAQNIRESHGDTNLVISRQVWEKALTRLLSNQAGGGDWDYGTPMADPPRFQSTMTAAGIGGIIICVSSLVEKPETGKIVRTPEIVKALARLERYVYPPPNAVRFDATGARVGADRSGYMLYSLERACMLGGLKKLGAHDWYAEGAADLLDAQLADGSWAGGWYSAPDGRVKAPASRDNTIETCFALLFLTKGYVSVPAYSP